MKASHCHLLIPIVQLIASYMPVLLYLCLAEKKKSLRTVPARAQIYSKRNILIR